MAAHDRQARTPRVGPAGPPAVRAVGRASVPPGLCVPPPGDERTTLGLAHAANLPTMPEAVDSPRQRASQSAARRYR
jgi:hypothetical protein